MLQRSIGTLFFSAVVALVPNAQGQSVDLTGQPFHELSEPFTSFVGIAEVAPGVVVTADIREKRLVRIDMNTGEISNIGREGSGPGEWQLPMSALKAPDNNAYVADMMQAKMHVISPEGEMLRSVPLINSSGSGGGMMGLVMPQGIDSRGRLYYSSLSFSPGEEPATEIPVVRRDFTADNGPVDTVAWIPNPAAISISTSGSSSSNRMVIGGRKPFQPRDDWVALANGTVAVISADPYQMTIHSVGNPPAAGPENEYTPVKIGEAERAAYRDRQSVSTGVMISSGSGGGGRSSTVASMGNDDVPDEDFPDVMPPFTGSNSVIAAPDGSTWVLRNRAQSDPDPVYDIFSVGGRIIGQATLRPNSQVLGFGENSVYVRWQDPDTDLLYLQQYGREPAN
jgi:hypothetical protein